MSSHASGQSRTTGTQFFAGRDFAIADVDFFNFVAPENSVLSFVTVEFGPQNLFTRLPVEAGLYSWINGLGSSVNDSRDLDASSARWEYRLTFGVDRIAVPEPAPLVLLGFGLLALLTHGRRRLPGAAA